MPFITRAREFLNNPNISSPRLNEMFETVSFLLQQTTPINTDRIVQHLTSRGYSLSPTQWQQEVLDPLRDHGIFIGSSYRGIFIPRNEAEAQEACMFYVRRIRAERRHLNIFADLIRGVGWEPGDLEIDE